MTPTTSERPSNVPAGKPPEGLTDLLPDHNNINADRINLIFTPWGWPDTDDFQQIALAFTGWERTAIPYGEFGYPVIGDELAYEAEIGVFGWEPFRSNRDKFNVWIIDAEPDLPMGYLNSTEPEPIAGIPNASFITLAFNPFVDFPNLSSLAGLDATTGGESPLRVDADPFANAMIAIDPSRPVGAARTLVHELGHALFGFADEYVGRQGVDASDTPRNSFWPSCAADRETAERWWGDLVGQHDPMIEVWAEEQAAAGFALDEEFLDHLREQGIVEFIEGGCFGDEGSFRPVDDTLMGFEFPAFGPQNRRAAEAVIDLFTGEL